MINQKSGLLERRMRATPWGNSSLARFVTDRSLTEANEYRAYRLNSGPHFFVKSDDRAASRALLREWDQSEVSPIRNSNRILKGELQFFSRTWIKAGLPFEWHRNPVTSQTIPSSQHWSSINEFGYGDIKLVWEMSRFSFAYSLVRAYWRSGNEHYAEAFWKAVESWRIANPPNCGANWKCGQEITFRVMAWIFGLYGFLTSAPTTSQRVAMLAEMIAVSGQRIAANIGYALSQDNNHGISEAAGLWTIGLLFPEFRDAEVWRELGKKNLEDQANRLIYEDGAFSQHSLNYHRLMLHDYLWTIRLGDLNGHPLGSRVRDSVHRAGQFLYQLQDHISGQAPNYGQNDGALILPLTNCDYSDYRPIVQSALFYMTGKRVFQAGPWDEELFWLFGRAALKAEIEAPPIDDFAAEKNGYYTLRSDQGFVFFRCGSFRSRPGQADMLHVDLWRKGNNVALDPGTYSYNAPDPWNNSLASTKFHNTVTIDNRDQMDHAAKFIWLPWLRGKIRCNKTSESRSLSYCEGEHDGYERSSRPAKYRRGILRISPAHWLILDALFSHEVHDYRLHWLLADVPYNFDEKKGTIDLYFNKESYSVKIGGIEKPIEFSFVRADEETPRGWVSSYYHDKSPALSVAATTRSQRQIFYTVFGPEPVDVHWKKDGLRIDGESWNCEVKLVFPGMTGETVSLVSSATIEGSITGTLYLGVA